METDLFDRRKVLSLIFAMKERYRNMPDCLASSNDTSCTCSERNRAFDQIEALESFIMDCDNNDCWEVL